MGGLTISLGKPGGSTSASTAIVPVAAPINLQEPKSVELLGHKSARRVGDKIHICTNCNFPISVYGRLLPCQHSFCFTCANDVCQGDGKCYLCSVKAEELEQLEALQGLGVCAHCLKTFHPEEELRNHITNWHRPLSMGGPPGGAVQAGFAAAPPPLPPGPRPPGMMGGPPSMGGPPPRPHPGMPGPMPPPHPARAQPLYFQPPH